MKFVKMHGIGNDFIFVEDLENKLVEKESEIAIKVCDRHFGIGADGLVLVRSSKNCDIQMTIINSDGSKPNMCGNAIRCFSRYVYDKGFVKGKEFSVETGDGRKDIKLNLKGEEVTGVRVFMGKESYKASDIPLKEGLEEIINFKVDVCGNEVLLNTALVGVPHTVIIDNEYKFKTNFGKNIEKLEIFKEGSNINFIKIIDKDHIIVRTWERGAGETLACGTGACASVAILNRLGHVSKNVEVTLPGGKLNIDLEEEGIYMTGPGEYICEGEIL